MKIIQDNLYHIYNRGNQKQQLFFTDNHFNFFYGLVAAYLKPYTDILSWCLMTNHFHFLIYANELSATIIPGRTLPISHVSEAFRLIQSIYAKSINADFEWTGNLFQQKVKSKIIKMETPDQALNTFHYIHENPEKAGLVKNAIDWKYSSLREFFQPNKPGLCNTKLAMELLDIDYSSLIRNKNQL